MESENDLPNSKTNGKIQVRTSRSIYLVEIQNIVRCEACKNYTTIYLQNEKSIIASHTLKDFESLLPFPMFLRVHNSHLVNSSLIRWINLQEACMLLSDNSRVPIASRKHDLINKYLKSVPGL